MLTIISVLAVLTGGIFLATRPSETTAFTSQTGKPIPSAEPVPSADPRTVAFQTRLDLSLQNMLDRLLGPGNSVVTTTATVDFRQTDPAAGSSVTSDDSDGTGGVLSQDNIQVPADSGSTAAGQYESGQIHGDVIDETTHVRSSEPGAVTRLTIVVRMKTAVTPDITAAQVKDLVGAAAGFDPDRGDSVTVLSSR